MYDCDTCDKKFDRKYNLMRHKQAKHQDNDLDSEMMNENSNISDTEEEIDDPMDRLVDEVFKQYQHIYEKQVLDIINKENISEEEARVRIYTSMRNTYRKALTDVFTDNVVWFTSLKNSPIFQSIKKTVNRVIESEDFDKEEAWKYAVNRRKFLFEAVLDDYNPPEVTH